MVDRCKLLQLMPANAYDEDAADAIAVWDWAISHWPLNSKIKPNLILFGRGGDWRLTMSLAGLLLGVINIGIFVAIVMLIGAIIVWFANLLLAWRRDAGREH